MFFYWLIERLLKFLLLRNIYYSTMVTAILVVMETYRLKKIDAEEVVPADTRGYRPMVGPLLKSIYSLQLEEVTRLFLNENTHFSISIEDDDIYVDFTKINKLFNLSQLIKYANFSHLAFDSDDFAQYVLYLKYMEPDNYDIQAYLPTEDDFLKKDLKHQFGHLHYAQKLAINIYTGRAYRDINTLLRHELSLNILKKMQENLPLLIITACLCSDALSQIPSTLYKHSYRKESLGDRRRLLQQRIDIATSGGAIMERGFISSGANLTAINYFGRKSSETVVIKYFSMSGKYIAPLSKMPNEEEILLLPTQITYTSYSFKDSTHYFNATPVIDLRLLPYQAQIRPIKLTTQLEMWLLQREPIGSALLDEINCLTRCENSASPRIMKDCVEKKYSILSILMELSQLSSTISAKELAEIILDSSSTLNSALEINTAGDKKEISHIKTLMLSLTSVNAASEPKHSA